MNITRMLEKNGNEETIQTMTRIFQDQVRKQVQMSPCIYLRQSCVITSFRFDIDCFIHLQRSFRYNTKCQQWCGLPPSWEKKSKCTKVFSGREHFWNYRNIIVENLFIDYRIQCCRIKNVTTVDANIRRRSNSDS